MIDTFLHEHAVFLEVLDELARLVKVIDLAPGTRLDADDAEHLRSLARRLLDAEPHHRREEEVLFPELERRGLHGPPEAMSYEHVELRGLKRALGALSDRALDLDLAEVRDELRATALPLIDVLRSHIAKENDILYPMALEVIDDDETWARLKAEADSIGYCCTTPATAG